MVRSLLPLRNGSHLAVLACMQLVESLPTLATQRSEVVPVHILAAGSLASSCLPAQADAQF